MDFAPIKREICPTCSRPTEGYYDERAAHMAAAFRSGVSVERIARAYRVTEGWTLKVITEQMGKEAVQDTLAAYWHKRGEEK